MNEDEPKKSDETGAVQSPYVPEMPPKTFDYDKYQDDTTIKACSDLLKCMGKNADLLVFKHDADNSVIIDNMGQVAQEMMNIIIDCKVPMADMQKMSDMLTQLSFQLFSIISKQQTEFERELLARFIGTRDPGTNKYSKEYASLGDMFSALIKLRKDQGDNVEDYYTLVPKTKEE